MGRRIPVQVLVDDSHAKRHGRPFVLAGLLAHGAELVGELVQYENSYRLCYVRGPEGIVVALAEKIG